MFELDLRTVLISISIINLLGMIVIFLLWRQYRQRFDGIGYWLVNFSLQFFALVFLSFRDLIPDFFSVLVSNIMIISGLIFLLFGFEKFLSARVNHTINYVLLGLYIISHTYFSLKNPDLALRKVSFSLATMLIFGQCLELLIRREIRAQRINSIGVALICVGLVLTSLVRVIIVIVLPPDQSFFESNIYDTAVLLVYQFLHIALTFALTLMITRRLSNQLEDLAMKDSLTGLINRRYFFIRGLDEVKRAIRYKNPLSIIMLDIDHFKKINDTYGHEAGDKVLVCIASILSQNVREVDIAARLGGEEFAILVPNTNAVDALVLAERLRNEIESTSCSSLAGKANVTASIGVASLTPEMTDLDTLLRDADTAMYQAKGRGRNRVVLMA